MKAACRHSLSVADVPYACQVCQFQSSLLEDIAYHVRLEHQRHALIVCPVCLQNFHALPPVAASTKAATVSAAAMKAMQEQFVTHMLAHADALGQRICKNNFTSAGNANHCKHCRLEFVTAAELKAHTEQVHVRPWRVVHTPDVKNMRRTLRPIVMTHDGQEPVLLDEIETRNRRHDAALVRPTPTGDQARCVECRRPFDNGVERHFTQ